MSLNDKSLLADVRLLVEQERVWDDLFFGETETRRRGDAEPVQIAASPVSLVPASDKRSALQSLYDRYKNCQACPLGATRIKFVFGVGNPETSVLFVGEGPGYEEDRRGEPFVGKAGQLLDKIMAAIGLNRQNSYIANIVKCHPMKNPQTPEARGNDRAPEGIEIEACSPILREQIRIISPRYIVTLGSPATRALLQTNDGITRLRGRLVPLPDPPTSGIQVLPTYHPAALLRNEGLKKDVWADMKQLRDLLAIR